MKKIFLISLLLSLGAIMMFTSCNNDTETDGTSDANDPSGEMDDKDKPYNISIFLDLSDRVEKLVAGGQMQKDNDIAIVSYFTKVFYKRVKDQKVVNSKDRMKVFFHPQPDDLAVAEISKHLIIDMSDNDQVGLKKKKVRDLDSTWSSDLKKIYDMTIAQAEASKAKNKVKDPYPGCDIWGFFKDEVDFQCIKDGYRNILVILTDGFIFHKDNMIKNGNSYSYILKDNLKNGTNLIVSRDGLHQLEVLILEVKPEPKDYDLMKDILTDWLIGMGVEHSTVYKSTLFTDVEPVIDAFLKSEK